MKLHIQIFAGPVGKKVILDPSNICMWFKRQQAIISREYKSQDRNKTCIYTLGISSHIL